MNASGEHTRSLWMRTTVVPGAPRLKGKHSCDTVVVGAGIAGLSVAWELVKSGQKVIVVDRGPIAGGMTSRTTAHLAPICDDGISALIQMRGEETARLFQQSQEAAVARIEENVNALGISCNFRRLDAFLFPAMGMEAGEARDQGDAEYDAARKVGAAAEKTIGVPLKGFEDAPALRYPDQATFHPLKYLAGLMAAIRANDGRVFANSAVTKIDERQNGVRLDLDTGAAIDADTAVFATNSPINDHVELHSKMAPFRTYAMAFTLPRGALPDALYWDMGDPYHYVRLNPGPGSIDYLIAGGADHKTGEADDGQIRFEAVEAWIRALVPALGKEVARWSGQVLDTIDYCGFIGRNPGSQNVFIVTGDSGQGMTHGALAGILLRDLIVDGSSPWQAVYDPARKTPAGVVNFVRENVTAIKNFAEYMLPGELESVDELQPGEGGIIRDGLSKIAACRDLGGKLHLNAAVCTHLGCHIHWNSTEQCWDCPCHGSQFAPDGAVFNGPAIAPLQKATIAGAASKARKTAGR
jgi:glycine/D-amino acid oxidase-like deaminating enzyme/nitrite reductase/ring-hydroxylating ferredoxin subunit